ncbi:MAG: class I SAM-dependent methyltransferase [Candidatus Diapherotrites archaeon]
MFKRKMPLEKFEGLKEKLREKRIKEAKLIKKLRKKDRRLLPSIFYVRGRSLKRYNFLFGTDISQLINKKLRQKEKISVLDVGAGKGRALLELKKQFGNKIITSSISLTRPKLANKKIKGTTFKAIDNVHLGRIENYKKLKKYDVIISLTGISWSTDMTKAVKNVYNSLNVGGIAFLHLLPIQLSYVTAMLNKKKIECEPCGFGIFKGIIIEKKEGYKQL